MAIALPLWIALPLRVIWCFPANRRFATLAAIVTMPFRTLCLLLLCLLVAGPMSTPAWALARPETRVGKIFSAPLKSASTDLDQTVATRRESRGCGYDFASGVCKYLYAHGNPVNNIDPTGHWTLSGVLTTTFTIANVASRVYVSYKVGHLIGSGIRFSYDEEMTFDELLDESLKTGVDIAGGWAVGRGVGFAFNRWIGPLTRKLTPLVWQRAHQLGRAAEASILARYNLFKNSKSLAELGGRGDFVPDGITSEVLREVKNVARLQLDDQIRAFASFCKDTGRKFVIHVRPGSKVDGTVVNEMQKVFGSGSRGSTWDIVSDIPDEMRIATQLAR